MASHDTLFTSDSSGSGSASTYLSDVFGDVSLPATNNSGLTNTALTNPSGAFFNDTDTPEFSVKTLYVKDMILLDDRRSWISNRPTYQIIFNENYPGVNAYAVGDVVLQREQDVTCIRLANTFTNGTYVGLSGVIRKAVWHTAAASNVAVSALPYVDNVAQTTVAFIPPTSPFPDVGLQIVSTGVNNTQGQFYRTADGSPALQTSDLHEYKVGSDTATALGILGVKIFYQNASIQMWPGNTYVNKNKQSNTLGATLAVPTMGSSLGGRALFYKTNVNTYGATTFPQAMVQSIAQGAINTNLATVTTGQGASFPVGTMVAIKTGASGSSSYVGVVTVQSTDTLTLSPTLPFGISGLIYKYGTASASLVIGTSQFAQLAVIGQTQFIGMSGYISDKAGLWQAYANGASVQVMEYDGVGANGALYEYQGVLALNNGGNGRLQIDGFFSAAEIEFFGNGILHATFSINGNPSWSTSASLVGSQKYTVFGNAGPGWNSIVMGAGNSMGPGLGVAKIILYQNAIPQSVTLGQLASLDVAQTYVDRFQGNTFSIAALGTWNRYYSDQLGFNGFWGRLTGSMALGSSFYMNHAWAGSTNNANFVLNFYGRFYGVFGAYGTSFVLQLDGVTQGATLNTMFDSGSEAWHKISVQAQAGTLVINHVDVTRSYGEIKNLQNYVPIQALSKLTNKQVPILSAWQQFNVSVSSNGGNPPVKATFAVVDQAMWRRVGDTMEMMWNYNHALNGISVNSGLGTYFFYMPPGLYPDFKKLPTIPGTSVGFGSTLQYNIGAIVGTALFSDAGSFSAVLDGIVALNPYSNAINSFVVYARSAASGTLVTWGNIGGQNLYQFGTTNLSFSIKLSVPINGWDAF